MEKARGSQSANGDAARPVSLLLVEDDAMVRGWVQLCLRGTEFRLAAVASSAAEALELAQRRKLDLYLIDYHLPDRVGTELVRDLRQAGSTAPALLMTANSERGFNETVRDAGAQGTVLKTGSREELLKAMRNLKEGDRPFDSRHPKRLPGRAALSPREREVLRLVALGRTNREISVALGVGDETVKTLLGRAFVKLGARRRAQAVAAAHERGLL